MMSVMHKRFFGNTFDIYADYLYNNSVEDDMNIDEINFICAEYAAEANEEHLNICIDAFLEEEEERALLELEKQYWMMSLSEE